ncbi:MAG: 3-deoxy-manno-octulosonate cytidylyltransferase [Bernardetiaceae bacterium]
MKKVLGIIPARYASTRFPGKVLVEIAGQTMLERVYRQASQAKHLQAVIIATDHAQVAQAARAFGANVLMTSPAHTSGTDRCAEALQQYALPCDFVLNIQADEPFIHPEQIDLLAQTLQQDQPEIATLIHPITDTDQIQNPNVVKVVFDQQGNALYFSRSPIPYPRQSSPRPDFYRHVGLYGYRADVLPRLSRLPPSPLEISEQLEQLRWLQNGFSIRVKFTPHLSHGIDTPEDLQKIISQQQIHP